MANDRRITGLILAAGSSSRAGEFKPALPIGNRPMILHCIDGMSSICDRIIVVGGAEFDRLRLLVRGLPDIECVQNREWRKGMFASAKVGLSRVQADKIFLLPADIPLVPAAVYRRLLAVNATVAVPSFRGRNGHPVCISGAVVPRILREPDGSILRDVLVGVGLKTVEVDVEEVLLDCDTREDLELMQGRHAVGFRPGDEDPEREEI